MTTITAELPHRLRAQAEAEEERRQLVARLFGPAIPAGADPVTVVTAVALHRDALARADRCVDEAALVRLLELAEAAATSIWPGPPPLSGCSGHTPTWSTCSWTPGRCWPPTSKPCGSCWSSGAGPTKEDPHRGPDTR